MISEPDEVAIREVTLHIMPSIRRDAEIYSEKEGVSLDQFVTVALAERLAHLRHAEWVSRRKPVTEAERRWALALLDRAGNEEVEPGDELPASYVRP